MRTLAAVAVVAIAAGMVAACADEPSAAGTTEPPAYSFDAGSLDPAAQRYLDAVAARDDDAVAAAFTPDATVTDVSREIRGREAIRRWAADEVIGGVYTLLGHSPRAGGTTMLLRFRRGSGDGFRATYRFDITDGLITRADLRYA
ncbi:nuclear transport factor 2 family protein [Nocardia pneumoniae]|uniref:nuclear transport factor 2 family protein n=1 Tax=Nocardia pneumoniae TaxID=228601 RepID=UPI0002D9728F|nr:nuclear transport factor 2 family protein [Nocardia pneumoniae]